MSVSSSTATPMSAAGEAAANPPDRSAGVVIRWLPAAVPISPITAAAPAPHRNVNTRLLRGSGSSRSK